MNEKHLSQKTIAIIANDGFEQSELFEPKKALEDAGAKIEILSAKAGTVKGWDKKDWGKSIAVDKIFAQASIHDYDALVLPGGVMNPDSLRTNKDAIAFIKSFAESGKPVAAICHGPWTLIEADFVRGKKMTSWPSLQTDLKNAGADWVDEVVVIDDNLITSRKPDDLPAFNEELISMIEEASLTQLIKNESRKRYQNLNFH